jgi:hypothetical protein
MASEVEAGGNPIESKRAEREAAPTRTFEALANRYLKEHAERHKRPTAYITQFHARDLKGARIIPFYS